MGFCKIALLITLIVMKEELLKKECLNLNTEESILLLQTLHLFLSRAMLALNIREKNVVEALTDNEKGKKFNHFLTLKPKQKKGDFCQRLMNNISSALPVK